LTAIAGIAIVSMSVAHAQLNITGGVEAEPWNSFTNDLSVVGDVDWWCFNTAGITNYEEKAGGTALGNLVSTALLFNAKQPCTWVKWSDGTSTPTQSVAVKTGVNDAVAVQGATYGVTFDVALDASASQYKLTLIGTDKRCSTTLFYSDTDGASWTSLANETVNNFGGADSCWIYTTDIKNVTTATNISFKLHIKRTGGGLARLGALFLGSVGGSEMTALGRNGAKIENGDSTPLMADGTDFGVWAIGQAVTNTFTISNSGADGLVLSGVPVVEIAGDTNDFTFVGVTATNIPAGSNALMRIAFSPAVPGTRMATVSIPNNDPLANPYNFTIAGGYHPGGTLYWDGKTSGGTNGESGVWSTTHANWKAAADFSGAALSWTNGAPAFFGGLGGIVTQSEDIVTGAITFRTGGYVVTSPPAVTLTLDGIHVDNLVQNNDGIRVAVAADVALGANALFSGGRGEKLTLSGGLHCGTHNLAVNAHFNGTFVALTGDVTGSGQVKLVQTELRLAGDNSGFTGTWYVENARDEDLLVQSTNALGNATRLTVVGLEVASVRIETNVVFGGELAGITNAGHTVDYPRIDVADDMTFKVGGKLTGVGLRKGGAGTMIVTNGANEMTQALTVLSGTLSGTVGSTTAAVLTVYAGAVLAPGVNGVGTFTHGGDAVFQGGTLRVDIGADASDLLAIEGDLDLSDPASTLEFHGAEAPGRERVPIMTYAGVRTGEFAVTNGLPELLRVEYDDAGKSVVLVAPSPGTVLIVK